MSDFSNDGLQPIDNILAQTAYQIGPIIYRETLPTATWEALIPRSELPEGVGDSLSTTIYDRSIPTLTIGGAVGVNWTRLGANILGANSFGSTEGQNIEGASQETIGSTALARMAFIKFQKRMRNYFLSVANIKSPYIDVHSVRTAAARDQQLGHIQGILTEATKWTWARRHETEFERNAGNFVPCMVAATSPILATVDIIDTKINPETGLVATGDGSTSDNPFFGLNLTDLNLTNSNANGLAIPTAYLSNAVLDRIYNRLVRTTDHAKAYGSAQTRPTWALRLGSDASLAIKREAGIRDDMRKSSWVDKLLEPLGVDCDFRGFYHMVDDLMPRFTEAGGALTRVEPFDTSGNYNTAYDNAPYEAFYVVQKEVMECQVPGANVSAPGVDYGAVDYRGSFDWLNIQDEIKNPKKTVGFFLGTFASASKPIKPMNGFVGLFLRTSSTPAL